MNFGTFSELEQYFVTGIAGYINPSLQEKKINVVTEISGVIKKNCHYQYLQNISNAGYKTRNCTIIENTSGGIISSYDLYLEFLNENPEGYTKVVNEYGAPDQYYPSCFSLTGLFERNCSGVSGVELITGTTNYYKKTFSYVLPWEYGLQCVNACWFGANIGDYCNVSVDVWIPGYNIWYEVSKFAEELTLFGDNEKGTPYPPIPFPTVSWIPQGCRIRVDYFKIENDNYKYNSDHNKFTTTDIFLDIDVMGVRKRA